MRTDPFRELDRLTQQVFGTHGTPSRPSVMPMDAWRNGDEFVVAFDLPGVDPDSIDMDVERNVVTVKAERPAREEKAELVASERPRGVFSRQLILGDTLDTARIAASYDAGVLTLRIPVAEKAKPRKIVINGGTSQDRAPSAPDPIVMGPTTSDPTVAEREEQLDDLLLDDELLALLCSDEDWVRAQFDAIMAGAFARPPHRPPADPVGVPRRAPGAPGLATPRLRPRRRGGRNGPRWCRGRSTEPSGRSVTPACTSRTPEAQWSPGRSGARARRP